VQFSGAVKPTEADVVAAVLVLTGHAWQLLAEELAVSGLYLPCTQPMHSVLPVMFLYCPGTHAAHITVEVEPKYPKPAMQRQYVREVLASARVVELSGQLMQPSRAAVRG